MFYTIYKITNLINKNIYVGQHATTNIDDGYMGSGHGLLNAYKKYGVDNFYKEILFVFDNFEEMDNKEAEIVNEDFIKRKDTYNIVLGGTGWCAKGTVVVEDLTNLGVYFRIHKDFFDSQKHKPTTKGTVQVFLKETGEKIRVSVDEYWNNKEKYNTVSTGKISVRNKKTEKTSSINIEDFNSDAYEKVLGGIVVNKNGKNIYVTKEEFKNDNLKGINVGKVTVYNKKENKNQHVNAEEYWGNKEKYIANGTGKVRAFDKVLNKKICISFEEVLKDRERYIVGTEGWLTVYDIAEKKFKNIKKENFNKEKHRLAQDKKIICYNVDNSVRFEFWGSKIDFLEKYQCPRSVWDAAIKEKIFKSARLRGKEFNGCRFALVKWKP